MRMRPEACESVCAPSMRAPYDRVRDSRAARACPSSQAADNWKSCAGRPFPSPGAEPAAHCVEVHERCALDQVCPHAPRTPHVSRAPLPRTIRRARPALCITSEALPRRGCSRPLAPYAHAGQSHCKIDGQSCEAHAGDASTCWVPLVAVRGMRTVYRGAMAIGASGQRRRRHRQLVMLLCHLLVDPPTLYF